MSYYSHSNPIIANIVSLLETIVDNKQVVNESTQTELSLRDKYATNPALLLNSAFDDFMDKACDFNIFTSDYVNIRECFTHPELLPKKETLLRWLIYDYCDALATRDGISRQNLSYIGINIPLLFDKLKKRSPYLNSTLPHVWYNYNKNKHYTLDIVRELKFFRQKLNGLDFDVTGYYLFLESEGIPIASILAHPKIKAQVGIDFNVYHHCPELEKFLDSPIFQKLLLTAECFGTDTIEKIKTRIISIAAVIYNLSRWSIRKLTTTDLIVNLTALLSVCIPIATMAEFFKRIFSPLAQSSEDESIRRMLKAFFLCIFILIVGKLPGKHTIDEFINRVHKFPQAFESIQKFWKQIDPITQTATNYIESELLGYDIIEEKTIMDEVQQWANLVEEYSDLYKKREIAKDKKTMLTAGRIHVDGVRLLSKCLRLHYSRENVELVRSLLPTTYKISEIAIRSGADHSKPRREPLIVWFCGKSGVGKSTLTYPFLCDMMKSELGPNEELPENWVQKIYARAPECEYFDGDPTDWMVYDDGFQIRDSVANPSPELFEIIRLGNMFPYMYHKASIEEKGNCFADVKGIVISSNIERIMAESIHCPEAVARRIKYAYKVHLRPEYRQYYIGTNGQRKYKLDKTKVTGPNLDIYRFQPFDPLTGEKFGHELSYQDMLLQCALALRQLGDEYVSYEAWLEQYRKKSFVNVTAQVGDAFDEFIRTGPSREQKILGALQSLRDGQCLTSNQVMTLQWLFGSNRTISKYAYLLRDFDIDHLRKMFEEPPVQIFQTSCTDGELDVFYEELYSNKFLSDIKKKNGVTIQRIMIDPSCELVRPFRNFGIQHVLTRAFATSYMTKTRPDYNAILSQCWDSWQQDFRQITTDPLRSIATGCYETILNTISLPFAIDCMTQYYFERKVLPSCGLLEKYKSFVKNRCDSSIRFEHADFVLRTQMPYVQTGPVVEEITDCDLVGVRAAICRYRARVKKIAKEAWAYTCANWPNLLLYSVGAVSATYTIYRFIHTPDKEDEYSSASCEAQSLDESYHPRPRKIKGQASVHPAILQSDDRSGPSQVRRQPRAYVQHRDESGPSTKPRVNHARVQAQLETDLRPDWLKPVAQGNTASAIDQQLYSVLDSRVYANTLMAYITPRGEDTVQRRLGHIIALRGSLFLMNYHFVLVLKEYYMYDVVIRQGNNVYHRCTTEEFIRNFVRVGKRDLVVFELERKGIAFGDLVKHIQTKSMTYSHNVQTVVLARNRLSGMCVTPNLLTSVDGHLSTSPISIELDMRGDVVEIVNAESWFYTGVTNNGDCGALLLLSNNRVPSKIVGVHNAFDPYRCKAIAVPLYREEVEEAMAFFRPRLQYGWDKDMAFDVRALEFNQGENFNVVRCEPGSVPMNCKTRLAKSPCFEELIPTKTKPGYLRPFVNKDGLEINPATVARAKWGYHLPIQDKAMAQRVTNAVVQVFMKEHRPGNDRYYHPMTTEEAIVGVEGVEGLNSINKVSSPGYPYVFQKIPGRGKTGYFGQYDFDLSLPGARQIIHEVEQMEIDILSNRRPFVVWIDTLKDARIPIEKAERGKTRIFSAGPMAYTILYRKYFLPCIAHTMHNRIDNHIAVGINPTSPEWHTLALKLKSKGKHCIAGDYACFDGKAPTEGYLSALEFFKAWYVEHWDNVVAARSHIINNYEMSQREFLEFLDKIFLEVVNHIHLMEYEIDGVKHHLFYSVCNGQPSGNPGTAMVNSAQGLWMAIRCWLELTQGTSYCTISQFFEHVYLIDYGDDVAMNISSEAIEFYNQNTLTRVMKKLFDIDFTDEKKTDDVAPDSRLLSEITFLKRGFVFNDDIQMYVSPMEVDTLLDILNWVRTGSEDARVITINNITSVVAELALISQEVFDEWLPRLKRIYSELAWRVNKNAYFDTRIGYLLAFRNAQFKSVDAIV